MMDSMRAPEPRPGPSVAGDDATAGRRRLAERLDGTIQAIEHVRAHLDAVVEIGDALRERLRRGGLLATAGNGGSAAEALHLAEELIGRYRADRRPLRAISLVADPTALSCIANDYGFEAVFARQVEALLGPDDALVVFSTSGRSPNLLAALDAARDRGALTVGLLGRDGGPAAGRCDRALVIPGPDGAHVQEAHQVVLHLLCEMLEDLGLDSPSPG